MVHVRLLVNVALLAAAAASSGPNMSTWEAKQADTAAEGEAVDAREAKMAAVDKVATMLEDVQAKVISEGEAEAKTYSEFACFCSDTTKEKTEQIKSGQDEEADLQAHISELSLKRDECDTTIKTLIETIEEANSNVSKAKDIRATELALYKANFADLEAGLTGLEGAIKALKSSKKPASLLQLPQGAGQALRRATLIADAYGLMKGPEMSAVGAFLQQEPEANPQVEFENYKFHSSGIIATLEKLQKDFQAMIESVDADEVKAVASHTMYLQEMANKIKADTKDLEDTRAERADTIAELKSSSEQLSTVSAELLDNQQYLDKLAQLCQDKKKTWDQRVRVRTDELSTLTQVIGIIKDAVKGNTSASTVRLSQVGVTLRRAGARAANSAAMEMFEAEAEDAEDAPALVQRRSVRRHGAKDPDGGRRYVASMLRQKGAQLKSEALTSLARQLFVVEGADPFAKVKQLINELIERLLEEAANEANQKGWCDKATAAATQKRTYASEAILKLNSEMAELEALRDKLSQELDVLANETAELKASVAEAKAVRAKEKAENEAAILEAKAGLEAVSMAKDVLDKFYKTIAKETVPSLAQQSPAEDAPDAGFGNFEAYTGSQGEAGGIIGMMEVIASDFTRTITETTKEEKIAEDEHLEFMTQSGISLGEKKVVSEQKQAEKDDAEEDLGQADEKLQSNSKTLRTSITELIELKAACIDTGMSYGERVAHREQEIEALKQALCILKAYAEYGPDGLADAC